MGAGGREGGADLLGLLPDLDLNMDLIHCGSELSGLDLNIVCTDLMRDVPDRHTELSGLDTARQLPGGERIVIDAALPGCTGAVQGCDLDLAIYLHHTPA